MDIVRLVYWDVFDALEPWSKLLLPSRMAKRRDFAVLQGMDRNDQKMGSDNDFDDTIVSSSVELVGESDESLIDDDSVSIFAVGSHGRRGARHFEAGVWTDGQTRRSPPNHEWAKWPLSVRSMALCTFPSSFMVDC